MTRRTVTLSLLAFAAIAMTLPSAATAKTKPTADADWYRHAHDDKYYTESWTTVALTEDGHFLNVNFVYSNIGVVSGNTSVNVAVTKPGAKQAEHFRFNHGTGDYAENKGTKRIVIGPNSMTLRGRELHVQVKEEGIALDLTIESWTDGVKWGSGKVVIDDGKGPDGAKGDATWMQTFFHVPRGDLRGVIEVGGKETKVTGAAYMDHTLQNQLATDFSTRWWTMRLFGPDDSLAFITFRTFVDPEKAAGAGPEKAAGAGPEKAAGAGPEKAAGDDKGRFIGRALWARRDGSVTISPRVRVKPSARKKDPKGHEYATRYSFSIKGDAGTVEGSVKSAGLVDREAFMEDLSWIERQVAEMVAGNPIVYRMKAKPDVTLKPKSGDPRKLDGPAVIESIVMRPDGE